MSALQNWAIAVLVAGGFVLLARLARRLQLPRMPLGLPLAAVLIWALLRSLPLGWLSVDVRLWVSMIDDLLMAYAAIPLLLWLALEIPGRLGWWRPPPALLVQLLSLGFAGLATVLIVQQLADLNLLGLVTTSAVATAMLGLAAQEALKDLLAGLELQLSEEFRVGDWIGMDTGAKGIVVSMTWRDTCLRDLDGNLVVLPNSMVTSHVMTRFGSEEAVSNRFSVGLDYAYAPARARALLLRLVRLHPRVLEQPAPEVRVLEFQESSIAYEVQVWSRELGEKAARTLRSELLEQIWYALAREGQAIPYAVRELRPWRPPRDRGAELPSPEECSTSLQASNLFAGLAPLELRQLVSDSRLMTFGPGELIVQEGADGESLYHLLRGKVSVLKQVAPDRIVPVADLGVGQVFGEMTLFLNTPRSASVRASEECLLLRVDRHAISGLLQSNPDLLERFARLVGARQAELENLSREARQERTNDLLNTMKRLLFGAFSGLSG
ncbi:MAG: mechanosensitive ion channel family protein [Synechococcaceae cyanobacterium]|nr:mechanosensitive ion channel family protein [Synechococcaceae cyanobacterium]